MTSSPSEGNPAGARYRLECTDCAFQTTVVGEYADALDAIEAHRESVRADPDAHFVNVHRID